MPSSPTLFSTPEVLLVREYASLGKPFVREVHTTPLMSSPQTLHINTTLSNKLGLNPSWLQTKTALNILIGNTSWPDYVSLASVYCGHQFGVFVPQLGDGRALMIAELRNGTHYQQLQLKGAGPTPYSRQGDGRAVLRSSIREYLASAAMNGLGISSTQALSLCASADPVERETAETAAVVCRVADSFLRFGHIEFFSSTQQGSALETLLEWHMTQHHPDLDSPLAWFEWLTHQTACLIAAWQSVGFCHGVLNTDNMSLLGLTLDYGPFGFMDGFDVNHICNHSDHQGRYSYRNQPPVAHWNLHVLAYALNPLFINQHNEIQTILSSFETVFEREHTRLFSKKLGFFEHTIILEKIKPLIETTLRVMHQYRLDFTRFFRSLSALDPKADIEHNFESWQCSPFFAWSLTEPQHMENAKTWLFNWTQAHQHLPTQKQTISDWRNQMNATNPAFVLRNHLLHLAIQQAQEGDFQSIHTLFHAAENPYSNTLESQLLAAPPRWAQELVLSCSS